MSKILSNNGYIKGLPVSLLMSKSSLRDLMRISTDYLTELHQVYDDPEATHELSLREALMRYVRNIAGLFNLNPVVFQEPTRKKYGAPDITVKQGYYIIGYIEAKGTSKPYIE